MSHSAGPDANACAKSYLKITLGLKNGLTSSDMPKEREKECTQAREQKVL